MRMRSPTRLVSGLALAGLVLAGCGDTASQDFCTQYGKLAQQAEHIRRMDVATAPPGAIRTEIAHFSVLLDRTSATAEGRLDADVAALSAALDDLQQAALDVSGDSLAAVRPLLQDSLDDVRQAWAQLQMSAAAECGAP